MTTLLLVSGSLRDESTNTATLRTSVDLAPDGVDARLYDGMASLPHFNPDDDVDPLPRRVVELRAAINNALAVVFCTPEYAGALPGSFKNLLDWTVGDADCVGKPVAWINVSTSPSGASNAHHSLRLVATYTGFAIVEEACRNVPVTRDAVDDHGVIGDAGIRAQLADALSTLVDRARSMSETD